MWFQLTVSLQKHDLYNDGPEREFACFEVSQHAVMDYICDAVSFQQSVLRTRTKVFWGQVRGAVEYTSYTLIREGSHCGALRVGFP